MKRATLFLFALCWASAVGCGDPFVEDTPELPGGYSLLMLVDGNFVMRGPSRLGALPGDLDALTNDVQLGMSVGQMGWDESVLIVRAARAAFVAPLEPGSTLEPLTWEEAGAYADSVGIELIWAAHAWSALRE